MDLPGSHRVLPGLKRLGHGKPNLLRALLNASELFDLAFGLELGRLRESESTFTFLYTRIKGLELRLYLAHKSHQILAARWEKILQRHRGRSV